MLSYKLFNFESPVKVVAFVAVAFLISVGSLGLEDRQVSHAWGASGTYCAPHPDVKFVKTFTDDDGVVNSPKKDPHDNGIDPGYDKKVAHCTAQVKSGDEVQITIANSYPSYTCRFWTEIRNVGDIPLRCSAPVIKTPPELTVFEVNPQTCCVLYPWEWEIEEFIVHIEQISKQGANYTFTIEKHFLEVEPGTIGFWKNWDSHNTFSAEIIDGWLTAISANSGWLANVETIPEMESVFKATKGKGATPESRFAAQYLATRLNQQAIILCAGEMHDVSGVDPGNFLELTDPENATLSEIINKIELQYPNWPSLTKEQFNIMKDICDALNNLKK